MKKIISRYFKFIISIFLICAMTMPSFATIAASDGSSFVTKAEFDSTLADFNTRLTTFEAGINSKIDSQVTTYLDRNGIWSGKDQTGGWIYFDLGTYSSSYFPWVGDSTYKGNVEYYVGWKTIVNSINKSGLACCEYKHYRYGSTSDWGDYGSKGQLNSSAAKNVDYGVVYGFTDGSSNSYLSRALTRSTGFEWFNIRKEITGGKAEDVYRTALGGGYMAWYEINSTTAVPTDMSAWGYKYGAKRL